MFACVSCQPAVNCLYCSHWRTTYWLQSLFSDNFLLGQFLLHYQSFSPLTSIPRNRSHQLPSLPFKTAAQAFLLNAFCPFSKAPHLTKTWVSSPCQSCTPGWPCVPCSKPRYVHKERVYGKTNGSWPASRKAVVFQFLLQWLVFKNHGCQAPEYYTCIEI